MEEPLPATETALSVALRRAGYKPPGERLLEIAERALAEHPRTNDLARVYIYGAVIEDAELLWEMFANWRGIAADVLLREVVRRRIAARQTIGAKSSQTAIAAAPQGGGSSRPSVQPSAAAKEEARVATAHVLSKLDTFRVNGKPIGDCTPEEALNWRASRVRDSRFVWLICAGIPAGHRIRDYIKPDDAEAFYQRAQEDVSNE
jgi:hypothetical protein